MVYLGSTTPWWDTPRDELTRYSRAETGAYDFLPSRTDLVGLGAGDLRAGEQPKPNP